MTSRFLQRVDSTGFFLTLVVAVGWALMRGWAAGAAVAVGGGIALLNLVVLRQVLGGVVSRMATGQDQPPVLLLLYGLKFGAMALLIFLLVALGRIDTLSLTIGMSVVPVAILVEWVRWTSSRTTVEPSESGAR